MGIQVSLLFHFYVVDTTIIIHSGAIAQLYAYFGEGSGPINMDDVACVGTESRLLDCTYTAIHNCGHSEDAGVTCCMLNSYN